MRPRRLIDAAGAALAPLMTRDQAKALADRVLAMSTADETRVSVQSGWEGNTRFAGGEIDRNLAISGLRINSCIAIHAPKE